MNRDQFYTKDEIARKCYRILENIIDIERVDLFLEPSAGRGSFLTLLPPNKRRGFDIDPKHPEIEAMDFFDYVHDDSRSCLVVGNPPFGRISSLAIKFFNHAATFCDTVAFILPRTFKRVSVQNKLDLRFSLVYSEDLPLNPCCFSPKMSAKCCFQVWKKMKILRKKVIFPKTHQDFIFLKLGPKDQNNQPTPPEGAHLALKAYGSKCGEIVEENLELLRPKSWHWVKSNIELHILKKTLKKLDYSVSKDTVRQDSLGQKELIYLYSCLLTRKLHP